MLWHRRLQGIWNAFAQLLELAAHSRGAGLWRECLEQMQCLKEPTGNTTAASPLNASSAPWQGPSAARTRDTLRHSSDHYDPLLLLLPSCSPLQHPSPPASVLFHPTCRCLRGSECCPFVLGGSQVLLKCSKQGCAWCLIVGPSVRS